MSQTFSTLRRLAAAAFAGALALTAPLAANAQSSVRVELGGTGAASQNLQLPRGQSAIVELPVDARDVLVSNPAVADAVLRTPRRIYVLGVAPGTTDAVFFDAAGRQILSLSIRVDQSTRALDDTIRRVAPTSQVVVEAVNDGLVLTGSVASASDSANIEKIAQRFVEKPEQVVNMLAIRGGQQVMIKVQVVEMQRNII
jgi:pilus assembly protein CpaC